MRLKYSVKRNYKEEVKRKLMYSVIMGMLAASFLAPKGYTKAETQAWWGTLYPKYCYSQLSENADGEGQEIRIRFRWLHGL